MYDDNNNVDNTISEKNISMMITKMQVRKREIK